MQSCKFAKFNFANYDRAMSSKRRIFAGSQLRQLRDARALKQADLAAKLGISAPYLSQLESDDRPLNPALLEKLSRHYPLDWPDLEADDTGRLAASLREALADPLFDGEILSDQLARMAEQQPALAQRFVALHTAYRRSGQRLEMIDEALTAENVDGARLPWEEVRDWFHLANNYVDPLDRAAEALSRRLRGTSPSPDMASIESHLRGALSISLIYTSQSGLRSFDPEMGHLTIDPGQPAESQRFQLAHQLASLALHDEITAVVEGANLRSAASRQLLFAGLCNYSAGALLMPYEDFRRKARELRHDID